MPAFCAAVPIREPKAGEYLLVIAKRFKATAQQANRRLVACRDWYGSVVSELAGDPLEGPGVPVE